MWAPSRPSKATSGDDSAPLSPEEKTLHSRARPPLPVPHAPLSRWRPGTPRTSSGNWDLTPEGTAATPASNPATGLHPGTTSLQGKFQIPPGGRGEGRGWQEWGAPRRAFAQRPC